MKVMIVDDQSLIRESLELMLQQKPEITVLPSAENGERAIQLAEENHPDIVLMDVRMPGIDGIEAMTEIKRRRPDTKFIILSTFDNDELVIRAIRNGAKGYLLKSIPVSELISSIHTVHNGGVLVTQDVASKVFDYLASSPEAPWDATDQGRRMASQKVLNRSEEAIVQLIAQGLSNKEITGSLNLSEGTVRNYISSILLKTGLRDRTQIAIWAVQKMAQG